MALYLLLLSCLGLLPESLDFKLTFFDNINVLAGIPLVVNCLISLVFPLIEHLNQFAQLRPGPVAEERNLNKEVYLLLNQLLLDLLQNLLILLCSNHCEI
jgi:hypothetical protein